MLAIELSEDLMLHVLPLSMGLLIAIAGCSVRQPSAGSPPAAQLQIDHSYVDLEPGWRVTVVTPILKSGAFLLNDRALKYENGGLVATAGEDFIGYEVDYYAVEQRDGGGISLRFSRADKIVRGQKARAKHPLVPLFDLPANDRFVRLLFFTRVSHADHDEGILAAESMRELDMATQTVKSDPERNCKATESRFCFWIPRGIVAQAEKRLSGDQSKWVWTW
jgi:hypothetical protein